jgi:glyoxylase-like metal-dependent hydrolase (beta-lactamase superfamily II)
MRKIAYRTFKTVQYGVLEELSALVKRVICNNPGPATYAGTGTYIIGHVGIGPLAVIDPGPDDDVHLQNILSAIGSTPVSHIFITHTHMDHSPLWKRLQSATNALTVGLPTSSVPLPEDDSNTDALSMEDHTDHTFVPAQKVEDGAVFGCDSWHLESVLTPGHIQNHVCYALHEENGTIHYSSAWCSSSSSFASSVHYVLLSQRMAF